MYFFKHAKCLVRSSFFCVLICGCDVGREQRLDLLKYFYKGNTLKNIPEKYSKKLQICEINSTSYDHALARGVVVEQGNTLLTWTDWHTAAYIIVSDYQTTSTVVRIYITRT